MNPWRWLDEPICGWPELKTDALGRTYVVGESTQTPHVHPAPDRDGWPDVPDPFSGIDPFEYEP